MDRRVYLIISGGAGELSLEYDWIICTYCEQPAHFNAGTLVIKDGEETIEVIGMCCAEKFLRTLLEKGPQWLASRR